MMRLFVMILIGLGSAAATFAADAVQSPDWKRYEIVVQRNMFSSRRQPPKPVTAPTDQADQTTEPHAAEPHPQPTPEVPGSHYVLVGTSLVGEHHIAFCEDRRDGRLIRLEPGDRIDDFHVQQVTQDAVVFEREQESVDIAVGLTLSGEVPAPVSSPIASPPSSTAPSTSPAPAAPAGSGAPSAPAASGDASGDDSTLSILERLRRRREQELQR